MLGDMVGHKLDPTKLALDHSGLSSAWHKWYNAQKESSKETRIWDDQKGSIPLLIGDTVKTVVYELCNLIS